MVSKSALAAQDLSTFSLELSAGAIEKAYSCLRIDKMATDMTENITKSAIGLSSVYCTFTKNFMVSVLHEAFKSYDQLYTIMHHIIPSAEQLSREIVEDAINTYMYCDTLCDVIINSAKEELCAVSERKKLGVWAEQKSARIMRAGLAKYLRKKSRLCTGISGSCNRSQEPYNPQELYADFLVSKIFLDCKVVDGCSHASTSSQSDKSRSSHCSSCESISSGLLSPQSTADSSGLYVFADKLLYSLSALEKGSNESISSTDTLDSKYSIVDCYRRSSAPELRVSSRKSSLTTVFEELPITVPAASSNKDRKLKVYPSTSLGRRLRSSDERRSASLENIDKTSAKFSYSDALANDILFSAYEDVI